MAALSVFSHPRGAAGVGFSPRHYRSCRQSKTQRVCLVIKVENHLPGHILLPRVSNFDQLDFDSVELRTIHFDEGARAMPAVIVGEWLFRSKCFSWYSYQVCPRGPRTASRRRGSVEQPNSGARNEIWIPCRCLLLCAERLCAFVLNVDCNHKTPG